MANYDPKRPRRNHAPSGLPGDPQSGDAPVINVAGDEPPIEQQGEEPQAAGEPEATGPTDSKPDGTAPPSDQAGNGQAAVEQPDGDGGTGEKPTGKQPQPGDATSQQQSPDGDEAGDGQPHGYSDVTDQQAAAAGTTTPPIDPNPASGPATHLLPRSPLPDRAVARATIAGAAAAFAFMFIAWRLRRCWLHRRAARLARRSTGTPPTS